MKILFWILTLFTLLHANEAIINNDPYKNIHYFTLNNGMQVYLLNDDKTENTQIKLTVNLGYAIEDDDNYGLAHLVEHMVFRDQRIPYHDYLDYIKEEGATYVNGYTRRYETGYLATIKNEKAYWVVETFAQMLFDKNVTSQDLQIEKGALQTEIGESHWYYKPMWAMKTFFEKITAPSENFYLDVFQVPKEKDLPPRYFAQENNTKFTLNEVMQRYNDYYYPANMKLFVVGNFDIDKMEQIIKNTYGKVEKKGTLSVKEPKLKAIRPNKPYERFFEGTDGSMAYLGTLYLLDDYRTYLILNAYTENLSQRLQQKMRNQYGKTYSVNNYMFSYKNAGVAAITFDALHNEFDNNMKMVKEMMKADLQHLDDKTIHKALKSYEEQYFNATEHDNDTLMELLQTDKYLREDHNITKQSAYDIFKTITPEVFKDTIKKTFTLQNNYSVIHRDYYFFSLEMLTLSLLTFGLFIFFYIRLYKFELKKLHLFYTHRDVLLTRRVSSRFTGFVLFVITFIISNILWSWIKYLTFKLIMGDPFYLFTIDVPYSYIVTILDPLLFMVLFFFIYRTLWRYYARIDVIDRGIVAIGNHVTFIPKEKIVSFEVTPWEWRYRKKTIGTALRFWKPLLKVSMQEDKVYYLRAAEASHLKEDLEKVLFSN